MTLSELLKLDSKLNCLHRNTLPRMIQCHHSASDVFLDCCYYTNLFQTLNVRNLTVSVGSHCHTCAMHEHVHGSHYVPR